MAGVVLALRPGSQEPVLPTFTDIAQQAGIHFKHVSGSPKKNYIFEAKGGGVGLLDYNRDGYLDIYFVNGSTLEDIKAGVNHGNALYRSNGNGTYTDVTSQAGVAGRGWGMGCAVGDYDNDGYPDLYVLCVNGNILYHNNHDGTFTDVTEKAGVKDGRWSTSAAFLDYDRDGYLDLYVANNIQVDVYRSPISLSGPDCDYRGTRVMCGPRGLPGATDALYHNNRDGSFTDVTVPAGVLEKDPSYGLGVSVGDYNNDGWPDIYVANDSTPSYLYINQKNGTFREVGLMAGVAVSDDGLEQAGMGVDSGDYDNDGWLDITKANFSFDYQNLYHNEHDGRFTDLSNSAGVAQATRPYVKWGTKFFDYDNDGWKDIFIAAGHVYPHLIDSPAAGEHYYQQRLLFHNLGNGRFADVSRQSGPGILQERSSRGVAIGDLDNDGDIDVVIVNMDGTPSILRNDGGNARNWLTIKLRGTASNRFGIGARIKATAGKLQQIAEVTTAGSIFSASDSRVHFGLGSASQADLEIHWPSGKVQTIKAVSANRIVEIDEDDGIVGTR
ncbi:MAG TPA: CRTAC1 family protein [Acidobacteriota bacterium]|nr:CRTAC1 family protein [Acidobacteriota bacterium]